MIQQIRGYASSGLYIRILATISTVYRPVTLEELPLLVKGLEKYSDNVEKLRQIVSSCGSFLAVRDRRVHPAHQSAKDPPPGPATDILLPSGVRDVHRAVFSLSLNAFLGEGDGLQRNERKGACVLRRDPYGLRKPGFPIEDVSTPDPDPIGPLRYSCAYWMDHLEGSRPAADDDDLAEGGLVDKFLEQRYLYWLEALSLMRILPRGVLAVRKLENMIVSSH